MKKMEIWQFYSHLLEYIERHPGQRRGHAIPDVRAYQRNGVSYINDMAVESRELVTVDALGAMMRRALNTE